VPAKHQNHIGNYACDIHKVSSMMIFPFMNKLKEKERKEVLIYVAHNYENKQIYIYIIMCIYLHIHPYKHKGEVFISICIHDGLIL